MLKAIPASENHQIQELKRMLGLESAALVAPGSNGDRIELPPSVHKLLKEGHQPGPSQQHPSIFLNVFEVFATKSSPSF